MRMRYDSLIDISMYVFFPFHFVLLRSDLIGDQADTLNEFQDKSNTIQSKD